MPCGKWVIEDLNSVLHSPYNSYSMKLAKLVDVAYDKLKGTVHATPLCWRRLYSEATLVWSLLDCLVARDDSVVEWNDLIARLDRAIIIAGAPGDGRLDLILDTTEQIQKHRLPLDIDANGKAAADDSKDITAPDIAPLTTATLSVPELARAPSISQFQSTHCSSPFVVRGFASGWPAISEKRWSNKLFLLRAGGRGRIVPVEVGKDYRTDDWTQTMMEWESYLDYLFPRNDDASSMDTDKVIYLAQHDLFKQFPRLRSDIIEPDYVYCCLSPPEYFPEYKPPGNAEQLVLNAWLGPKGTLSPAHTDPFFNIYVQVVGYKTVWFAPPSSSAILSPNTSSLCTSEPERKPQLDPMLSNTTSLDVFSDVSTLFRENVVPHAMSTVLGPGDLLFFPPGWWHALRSESVSFSTSMWF